MAHRPEGVNARMTSQAGAIRGRAHARVRARCQASAPAMPDERHDAAAPRRRDGLCPKAMPDTWTDGGAAFAYGAYGAFVAYVA